MPKSKKPRKSSKGMSESVERLAQRMESGLAERRKRKLAQRERNLRLSKLPMGHPFNRYVLDITFAPLEKMFADQERTGGHMFDDAGRALMWVELDQCYTPIVEACFEMHAQFEFTAGEYGWGDVPPGLLAYGMKLMRGVTMDAQDIADARATVAWMREKLSTINCFEWVASMKKMEGQNKEAA